MIHPAAVRAAQTVTNLVLEGVAGIDAPTIITAEYAPLVNAARNIAACGVTDIDERLKYVEIQVGRGEWRAFCAALKEVAG